MNRILFEAKELDPGGCVALGDERARHLLRVLRVQVGGRIRAGVLDGPLGEATVESIAGAEVSLRFVPRGDAPARPRLDLVLALPRPKVLKRLWAQLAALGVGRILVSGADRVEKCYFDSHALDPGLYRPRLVEGLQQQASDTRLPTVRIFRHLRAAVEEGLGSPNEACARAVLHPHAAERLDDYPPPVQAWVLALGPEGGWTPQELTFLEQHGFSPRRLGCRTLRLDTACIAAIAVARTRMREGS